MLPIYAIVLIAVGGLVILAIAIAALTMAIIRGGPKKPEETYTLTITNATDNAFSILLLSPNGITRNESIPRLATSVYTFVVVQAERIDMMNASAEPLPVRLTGLDRALYTYTPNTGNASLSIPRYPATNLNVTIVDFDAGSVS